MTTSVASVFPVIAVSTDPVVDLIVTGPGLVLVSAWLLVSSALAWSGRWRKWARSGLWGTIPIHVLPGLGLLALHGAIVAFFDPPQDTVTSDAVLAVLLAIIFTGTLLWSWGVWGKEPRWAQPKWLREADRSLDIEGDELNAMLFLAATVGSGHHSKEEVEQAFAGQTWIKRWRLEYVYDPAPSTRANVMAGPGKCSGWLAVYPTGLAFFALAMEERMRDATVSLSLPAARLARIWTVPAKTDAFAQRHPIPWKIRMRLAPFRRLAIATDDGATYLFETVPAGRRADALAEQYGIERGPDLRAPVVRDRDG